MDDCIFCSIIKKDIPSSIMYEDDNFLFFKDIYPKAKIHLIAVPKIHYTDVAQFACQNEQLLARLFVIIAHNAEALGLKNGYRIVTNKGSDANQTVPHVHFHIMGGEFLP